jgi:DNA segregation ATPase FtsK/SpoIIIE, S-DNA-T family
MPVRYVERPQRRASSAVERREFVLNDPPVPKRTSRADRISALSAIVPGLGSMAMIVSPGMSPLFHLIGAATAVPSIALIGMRTLTGRRGGEREKYLAYLRDLDGRVEYHNQQERAELNGANPDPVSLAAVVDDLDRLWERRPGDGDFVLVRIGTGSGPASSPVKPPATTHLDRLDPTCVKALHDFVDEHANIEGLPLLIDLRQHPLLVVHGPLHYPLSLVRAMITQLAVFHGPDDVVIAIATAPERIQDWEWTKWLPHTQHHSFRDITGPVPLIAHDHGSLHDLLKAYVHDRGPHSKTALAPRPFILVVFDGITIPSDWCSPRLSGLHGATLLELVRGDAPADLEAASLAANPDMISVYSGPGASDRKTDEIELASAETVARRLAPLRLRSDDQGTVVPAGVGFAELMGIGDPRSFDPGEAWRQLPPRDRLRVPIGVGMNGEPVVLDIKEAALGGMGPHGLCIGATGSGKSEVLRTLVLALAVTHSSENLNFVLSDFKGGATFAGMAEMPHTAAVITNLADDLTMVDRMRDAIVGEMNRRQELLRDGGSFKNIHDYEIARAAGATLVPMPNLVIVLDEFSEMLTAKPEFLDLFIQIGRIGRSLGVHLLLASQRLEEGKLRGLDTFLSYRLGLKTFSEAESRIVLGTGDAFRLPQKPGSGYLKSVGANTASRAGTLFKAAYVSGPSAAAQPPSRSGGTGNQRPVVFSSAGYTGPEPDIIAPVPVAEPELEGQPSVLDALVAGMKGRGPRAHQVWLPPLTHSPTLGRLLGTVREVPGRGLTATAYPGTGRLTVPVGIADKPLEQKHESYHIDLSGAAGHVLVVGGPRSGKSTFVRTVLTALALTHSPEQVQFFLLDFSGGGLSKLGELPHSCAAGDRHTPEILKRAVKKVASILEDRERAFREHAIESIEDYRARRARGELPDEEYGDVFLVVDGWQSFKADFGELCDEVAALAQRGLGYGVHVLLSTARWADVRPSLKDVVHTRIELRLGDPAESDIDRRRAANVPEGKPGHGLIRNKLHLLAALPCLAAPAGQIGMEAAAADTTRQISRLWPGKPAPQLRLLPELLPWDSLPTAADRPPNAIPLGIEETRLDPVHLDFTTDPHFVIFGESESGKTTVLRTIIRGICDTYSPSEARILLVDYRRTLLGAMPDSHRLEYCASAAAVQPALAQTRPFLEARQPGLSVTTEQLRNRSWWSGPDVYLIVDDYDLVAGTGGNPLVSLADLLPLGRDLGLHVILARASGGAGRALFEPVMQRLRDMRQPGLILSGDREEGALLGNVRPSRQPPGRGMLIPRKQPPVLIQTAHTPERA